jgi:glucokinase
MSNLEYYAGIDIGATNIKYGIFDSAGKVIYRDHKPSLVEKGAKPLLHLITNIGENLLLRAAEDDLPINWLGVGSPGSIDTVTGAVKGMCPNIPGWGGTEIAAHLKQHLNIPVYVDNDANAMALGELRFGAARIFNTSLCITVGTGVGGGLILNKSLWRGSNFSANEVGHIIVDMNGPKCLCGNKGCLEVYCSSEAILNRARAKMKQRTTEILDKAIAGDESNLSIKKLFFAARKGDELAAEVIEETARIFGAALSGVVNLLNPEALIFGGGIIDGGAGFIVIVGDEIKKRSFQAATENLKVIKAELGNDAGFIGAGLLGEYRSRKY